MTETCKNGDYITVGNFRINNNKWGQQNADQCVYDSPTPGWRWNNNGAGVNYPSSVVGTNFCNWPSTWNKFPIQWKNINSWNITLEWNYPQPPSGDWNLSFDIYFWDQSGCGGDNHKIMNNMVWIQGGGGLFYPTNNTIVVDGKTYYLDDPSATWPRHNFILKDGPTGAGSYTVDLKKLLSTQSGLDGNWYIDGIHFGNEYGSNSKGETHITKYIMEINGETISLDGSTPQKYRCTGSPDYKCVADPNGSYNSLAECQAACKSTPIPPGYSLIFEDHFDGNSLDTSKWNMTYGVVAVQNSNLVLGGSNLQGGEIRGYQSGVYKFSFKYGYVEFRSKLADAGSNKGYSNQLWLAQFGDEWEIDVTETSTGPIDNGNNYYGINKNNSTYHWGNYSGSKDSKYNTGLNLSSDYHLYAMEWTPDFVRFLFDGTETLRVTSNDAPITNTDMCLIMGLCARAGSGCWPTTENPTVNAKMYVDYVRVYQKSTVTKYKCSGSPNYQCVADPNGQYNSLAECQAACKPTPTKYKCSGSPNYQCVADPNGQYNSLAECQAACKPTPTKYKCSGSPNYQCVADPNGQYNSLAECQAACKPTPTKYKCSGSPNYQCVADPNGQYNSLAECQAACKPAQVKQFNVYIVGTPANGILVMKSPTGNYTADDACKLVCDTLKNM